MAKGMIPIDVTLAKMKGVAEKAEGLMNNEDLRNEPCHIRTIMAALINSLYVIRLAEGMSTKNREIRKALRHQHKHTDECLAYAAQTGRAFCIAECSEARAAAVAEE